LADAQIAHRVGIFAMSVIGTFEISREVSCLVAIEGKRTWEAGRSLSVYNQTGHRCSIDTPRSRPQTRSKSYGYPTPIGGPGPRIKINGDGESPQKSLADLSDLIEQTIYFEEQPACASPRMRVKSFLCITRGQPRDVSLGIV
jgi:hypothetical protein